MKKKNRPRDAEVQPGALRSPLAQTGDIAGLRVIGGSLRHRKIAYSGDPRTRPMKDRTREAIYNLLGEMVAGSLAVDLFAGTGALGIEALSRGAVQAVFFEKHFPTADMLRRALAELGIADKATVMAGDTFLYVRRMRGDGPTLDAGRPWIVFCSPPFDFYVDRAAEMLTLIDEMMTMAPPESIIVVEADERFDFATLPQAEAWRLREYSPAVVGMYRKENPSQADAPTLAN